MLGVCNTSVRLQSRVTSYGTRINSWMILFFFLFFVCLVCLCGFRFSFSFFYFFLLLLMFVVVIVFFIFIFFDLRIYILMKNVLKIFVSVSKKAKVACILKWEISIQINHLNRFLSLFQSNYITLFCVFIVLFIRTFGSN